MRERRLAEVRAGELGAIGARDVQTRPGEPRAHQLISDGADGLCTRHRVSPYQIEAAGKPLRSLNDEAVAAYTGSSHSSTKAFMEVDISRSQS